MMATGWTRRVPLPASGRAVVMGWCAWICSPITRILKPAMMATRTTPARVYRIAVWHAAATGSHGVILSLGKRASRAAMTGTTWRPTSA